MAPSYSKQAVNGSNKKTSGRHIVPVIPLARVKKPELIKGEYIVIKCRTNPSDSSSPTYDLPLPYFKTGTPEEFLTWLVNYEKACTGQNCDTAEKKYAMAKRLLDGNALAVFTQSALTNGQETDANLKKSIDDLTKHIFPKRAAQTQKRFMRRFLKKPADMTTRDYVSRVIELNGMFERFPSSANYLAVVKLDEDELLDLLEYGLPLHWQLEMVLHDFDPADHTIQELVSFCERLELTKPHGPSNNPANSNSSSKSTAGTNDNKPNSKKRKTEKQNVRFEGEKFCSLHGQGNHSSDECYAIKKMVKDRKASLEANQNNSTRKPEVNELHTILNEALKQLSNKKPKQQNKKQKRLDKPVAKELKAFEQMSVISGNSNDDTASTN
jgi:hypothetical protein